MTFAKSLPAGYEWGEPACGGIAVGLAAAVAGRRLGAGEPFAYRFAVANRGRGPRTVTLFVDIEDKYRSRVHLENLASARTALGPAVVTPTTSGLRIEVALAPGEVRERAGHPLVIPPGFAGENRAFLTVVIPGVGGAPACEARSGAVPVTVDGRA